MSTQHDESTLLTETDAPNAPLDRDDVFHILQCRRRRLVLKYLQEHDDGPADMRDITERIAALENDTTVAQLRSQERQRVYIALYQSHLPKMDRDGIIEYEQNRGIVRRTERTTDFEPYLVHEPTLFPDEDHEDDDLDEQDVVTDVRDPADSDGKRGPIVAAGGGLVVAASIYAGVVASLVPALLVGFAGLLLVAFAAGQHGRGTRAEADA